MIAPALLLDGIAVYEDPRVPLTKTRKDGSVVGAIHVHPDRMPLFKRMFVDEETP